MAFNDLVNNYKKRLSNDNVSIRDEYVSSIKDSFLDSFDSNVNYEEVQYKGKNDLTYMTYPVHMFQVKNDGGNETISLDHLKQITFKDLDFISTIGDSVKYNNADWLVINTNNIDYIHSCAIRQCSTTLKWQSSTSTILEYPCYIEPYKRFTKLDIQEPLILPVGMMRLHIQYNEDTNSIIEKQRFIISGKVYHVNEIDNFSQVFDGNGLISLVLEIDQYNAQTDRLDLRIADYVEHNYSISILNGSSASIKQGDTPLQLNVEVLDNNVLVPSPIITFSSSDPLIASVDTNGLITAINSGGNCVITATSNGVSDSIAISISAVVTHNYTVDIIPSGILKVGQTITANALFKDNGILTSDIASSWWVLADDDVSSTNQVSITYNGNTTTIVAGSISGYVRLHVDGYNCQGSIRLQVASLW